MPDSYKHCESYSDFWDAYQHVFPKTTHQSLGKQSSQTNHVKRWNNTLCQRMARFVRKTLSFSKSLASHHMFTKGFIFHDNLDCSASCRYPFMMLPMMLGNEEIQVRAEPMRVMGMGKIYMDKSKTVAGFECVVLRLELDEEGGDPMEFALAEGLPLPCYSKYGSGSEAVEVRLIKAERQ